MELIMEQAAAVTPVKPRDYKSVAAYTSVYGFHGVHGRALALAGGLKAARPDLTVLVAGGDGDGLSIGGNHFIHACRRNMDMTYIIMDNEVYGMTKGQASPTTDPEWSKSKLTPGGAGIRPFNPAAMALTAGATFIARGFTGDPNGLAKILVAAIEHKGFSFVQALSPCKTFRPEQMEWKKHVRAFGDQPTSERALAAERIHADDGMSTGIVYQGQYPVYQPGGVEETTLQQFDREFVI
jgi:2-oxoglutarate ferredoxin oxidoreductase subunit beta